MATITYKPKFYTIDELFEELKAQSWVRSCEKVIDVDPGDANEDYQTDYILLQIHGGKKCILKTFFGSIQVEECDKKTKQALGAFLKLAGYFSD